jgi:hypothetical protein
VNTRARSIGSATLVGAAATWALHGGWPAAATVAAVLVAVIVLVLSVLGSEKRTERMLRIIVALRLKR